MRDKLVKFMSGRYGIDALYRFLLLCAVLCTLLSVMLSNYPSVSGLCNGTAFLLLAWTVFRIFSRNIEKRYLENLHYLEWTSSIRRKMRISKEKVRQRKEYKFFVCPTCKTNLRVPKGKGKINITCSKCGTRFQRKT